MLTTKVGYDITAERKFPGQSERPHDWRPESVREQCDASLQRLGTDHIDLYQLHNTRIEPILDDDLWDDAASTLKTEGKVRELGVALGPAIGWVEEGNRALDDRPIVDAADGLQRARAGARPHVCGAPTRAARRSEPHLARVPHASDTLSGKVTPDTVFDPKDHRSHRNRDNMLDNFEKAETLRVPLGAGDGPHDRAGRDRGDPRQPGVRHGAPDRAHGRRGPRVRGGLRLPAHRRRARPTRDALFARNFDHDDRYVMPLKSSV